MSSERATPLFARISHHATAKIAADDTAQPASLGALSPEAVIRPESGGTPTQVSWKSNVNGLWSVAANWTGGVVPGANNAVVLDTLSARTVTFASGTGTIYSMNAVTDTLNITGGTLTVLNSAVFDAGLTETGTNGSQTLILDGAAASVAGSFNPGIGYVLLGTATTLSVTGPATFGTAVNGQWPEIDGGTLATSGTTTIGDPGNPSYPQAVLGGGIVWDNSGVINDGGVIQTGDGIGATAAFVNAAGAVFDFVSDDGQIVNGTVYGQSGAGRSAFSNAGTLEKIGGNGGTSYIESAFTNTGLVSVATGTIEFDGGGTFGGTFTGAGQIAFGGGNATLTAGTHFTVANGLVDGAYLSVATALAYTGNLTLTAGELQLDGTNDVVNGSFSQLGNSTLSLNGSSLSLTGANLSYGYLEGPGTLTASGTTTLSNNSVYYLGDGVTLINTGTINDNDYIDGSGGGFSIINNAGATFNVNYGIYLDSNYGDSTFTNAGTFQSSTSNYFYVYSYFVNTGVIQATGGTIQFDTGGVFGGTLTGNGVIDFAGGSGTLTAGAVYNAANLEVGGGSLTLDANATPANASFSQSGGTIYLNGNTLALANASLSYGYLEGGGTLSTSGTTNIAGVNYAIGNGVAWVNSGTVDQDGTLYGDSNAASSFDLQNLAGATYDITGGYYFGYTYNVAAPTLENAGTFALNAGIGNNVNVYAYVTNTGTIASNAGTLNFQNGGLFGGTLTGSGTIGFAGGNSTLTAGSVFNAAGLYLNGGSVEISATASFTTSSVYNYSGALQIDQNVTLAAGVLNQYDGTLYLNGNTLTVAGATLGGYVIGAGTLVTNGATALNANSLFLGNSAVWNNTGTVTQAEYVYDDTSYAGGYTVNNQAGAVYTVAGSYYLGYYSATGNSSTFNNAGTFASTLSASTATVYGQFNNASTGTISISTGNTISLDGGGSLGGTVTGKGTLEFQGANFNLGGMSASSNTGLLVYGSSLNLTANVAAAGVSDLYQSAVNLGSSTLSLTGSTTFGNINAYYYGQDSIDGPGILSTTSGVTIGDYAAGYLELSVGGGATWSNSGKVSAAGLMQLGDGSGAGTLINLAAGTFALTTNDANVDQGTYVNGFGYTLPSAAMIINSGLFEKTGGTGTSSVYATFVSTGTIATIAGTLALDNGGNLSGLIADKSHILLSNGVGFSASNLTVGGGGGLANAVTLDETGTLSLGDSSSATLAAAFSNTGTYEIDGNGGIVAGAGSTAADLFTNASTGLLEKISGTGRSLVSANVANTGTILANAGTLALTGTVTGTGKMLIGAGAVLELGASIPTTQTVSFTANTGTLALDTVSAAHGAIAGFTVGDVIDLVNTTANSATLTGTTLVVYNGTTAQTTLSLTGTHTGDTYSFLSDGHGGTLLGISANATSWKGTTADWNATNAWTNGAPSLQTSATVTATAAGKFTLSLAASETASARTLLLDASTATYAIAGLLNIGSAITLQAGTLSLAGTIDGGTLALAGGTANYNGGTLDNVVLQGALNLAGAGQSLSLESPFTLTGASGSGGGTINITGANSTLYVDGITTLSQDVISIGNASSFATLASNDADGNGGVLTLDTNTTLTQTGLYAALSDSGTAYDAVLNSGTMTAAITSGTFAIGGADIENDGMLSVGKGDTLVIGSASFVNAGTLTSSAATLTLGGTFQNTGSITTTNTALNLNGTIATAQLPSLLGGGDTVSIGGTLVNTGATLNIGTGTQLGQVSLTGTIVGGTIADAGNGLIFGAAGSSYGTLSGVTYQGALNLNGNAWIQGSFAATGAGGIGPGTINDTGATEFLFDDTRTLSNVTINLGNSSGNLSILSNYDDSGSGSTLTLASSVTVSQAGTAASLYLYQTNDQIINQGIISAGIAAGSFTALAGVGGSFTNQGTIIVSGGDQFALSGPGTFTNLAGTTLTGGSIIVDAGSSVQLAANASIATDAATLTLSGAGSSIESQNGTKEVQIDAQLSSIKAGGVLNLAGGRNMNATANHGSFSVGGLLNLSSSNFTATALTIAGGTLSGYGTVTSAIADAGVIAASGGTLQFNGAVTGAGTLSALAGATVDLTQSGTLTEAIAGAGTLKLDAASTVLVAGGTAAIANIIIDAGETLSSSGGTLAGATADAGTLSVTAGTLAAAGAVTGAGTLSAGSGAVLDLAGGGSFGGAITGAGLLQLDGATTFTVLSSGSLGIGSVLVDAPATLDLFEGGALASAISGAGTLQLDGTTPYTIAGSLGVATLLIDPVAALSGSGTIAGAVIDNGNLGAAGTLTVDGPISGTGTLYAAGGALLALQGGGTLSQTISGAGTLQLGGTAAYTLSGGTVGISTLALQAGATLSGTGTLSGSVTDAGTLAASGGLLQVTGALTGTGALVAGTGAVLDLTLGEALTETASGLGTLQLDNGTYTLAGGTDPVSTLAVDAGAALSGYGVLAGATSDAGSLIASGGTLAVGALSGNGALVAGASAVLDLTAGAALTQSASGAGTLQLDSGLYSLAGAVDTVSTLAVDSGAALTGYGSFAGAVTDTGTITAAGGTLVLGAFSGAGALDVAIGATLDLTGGGALSTLSNLGTLLLDGSTAYTFAGPLSAGTLDVDAGATLSGTGTLSGSVADAGTIAASSGTLVLAGAPTGSGILAAASGTTLKLATAGTLTETASGLGTLNLGSAAKTTFTLAGATLGTTNLLVNAGIIVSGYGTISSAVSDTGTLIAAGGKLVLGGALSATATLQALAGASLDLTAGGALSQAISGAGTLELGGAYKLGAKLPMTSFLQIDAGGALSGTGSLAGAMVDNGTIAATSGTLTLAGALTSGAGTLSAASGTMLKIAKGGSFGGVLGGLGTIQVAAATTLTAGATLSAAKMLQTANVILGAGEKLMNHANDVYTITASTGTVTLSGAAGDSLTNAGTLAANGAGAAHITTALVNTGAVSISAGTLSFIGGVTNSGTVSAAGGAAIFSTSVAGTGALAIGATSTLSLLNGAGAGQTVDFAAGTGALDLASPAHFLERLQALAEATRSTW